MKPTDEQLENLMYLIELTGMMDDESVGDRFGFKNSDGKKFIPNFLEWLKTENPDLLKKIKDHPLCNRSGVEYLFWFDNLTKPGELEYESFKECARYILLHKEAFEGVIKELTCLFEDEVNKEFLEDFEWWEDIEGYTDGKISSLKDAKKMFENLKKKIMTRIKFKNFKIWFLDQVKRKVWFRNFFITRNAWGAFSIDSHIN